MNKDVKVNLNITLPGRVMYSEQECSKNPKVLYDFHTKRVIDRNNKPITISYSTRKCKPATQVIRIYKESYDYMIDGKNCPHWEKPFIWNKMNREQRLRSHLHKTMEDLGGTSFTYVVFED